jgi:hypothetical protein
MNSTTVKIDARVSVDATTLDPPLYVLEHHDRVIDDHADQN